MAKNIEILQNLNAVKESLQQKPDLQTELEKVDKAISLVKEAKEQVAKNLVKYTRRNMYK